MIKLTDEQIARYFKRSFTSTDGLWFMKLEEHRDFDTALEIDAAVWKIVPKIQARTLKEMAGLGNGIDALREALETRLSIEDYDFEIKTLNDSRSFMLMISGCPWLALMRNSGREHLAERIGETICGSEYEVWAAEFGDHITFTLENSLCGSADCCMMKFAVLSAEEHPADA